jgi:hypothetical protein
VIKRDGVALASKRGKHLTTRIDVQKLKPGTHFVNATVTDAFGRRAIKRLPFERCARAQPDPDD